jgi:hypothetical protein
MLGLTEHISLEKAKIMLFAYGLEYLKILAKSFMQTVLSKIKKTF